MKNTSANIGRIISAVVVLFILLLVVTPVIQTVFTSLKTDKENFSTPVSLWPRQLYDGNYIHVVTVLGAKFFIFFKNSVVVTSVSVFLILLFSSLCAYGLARIDFIGKKFIIFFMSFIIAIPLIITVIPIYMIETALKIKNTNLGLILPYVSVFIPIPLFILYGTFLKVPRDLEEAAIIDGCKRLSIYRNVFLPLSTGGLISAAIITFLFAWGEFLYALILNTKYKGTTLPIGIMLINFEEASWALGPVSAVLVLSIFIPITLYFILQRYFIQGMMEGAIKG
jgi:ABC-type glycerol-3-phosphate transport system permease component